MAFWKRQRKTTVDPAPPSRETSDTSCHEVSTDQYGMMMVWDKHPEAPRIVDVVAIHGLNGHYQKTWSETTPQGSVNWLLDFLPQQLPHARIMSYSYNSTIAFSKAQAGIRDYAEQLLEDLMAWRLTLCEQERPVLFICHSLGGIVFKQALIRAHERERYTNLPSRIRGVAFFGTPHRGVDLADWGLMLANIIKSISFGTRTNTKVLNELRGRSDILQDISKSFVDRSKNLVIISFYETDKMDYLNCKVVSEQSAILNLPNETSIAITGNHRTICRFSNANEQRYRNVWVNLQSMASIRHVKADPGCGKSVLTRFLIDAQSTQKSDRPKNVCYFFFKSDSDEQKSSTYSLCAMLHQIYTCQPELLKHASPHFARKGSKITKQFDTLWAIFLDTVTDSDANDVICLIDGLDECEKRSRSKLMTSLAGYFRSDQAQKTDGSFLKIIITSRPDNSIKAAFQNLVDIRLRGEDETSAISHDVELVVRAGISMMSRSGLPKDLLADLQSKLIEGADRTFLWTTLTMKLLKDAAERGASKQDLDDIILSRDIDEVYARLLEVSANSIQAKDLLQIVVAAARPLTLDEMNVALTIPAGNASRTYPITNREIIFAKENPPEVRSLEDLESRLKLSFENYVKSLCGHFVRIIDQRIYLVHLTVREYLVLVDPDFKGFEAWTSAHTSYSLNFPGRMHIPGADTASDREHDLRRFFGLEERFSLEKIKAAGIISIDSVSTSEHKDASNTVFLERDVSDEDEDDHGQSKIADRFQRYQDLEARLLWVETPMSVSHAPRGNLFPVKSGSLILSNNSFTFGKSKERERRQT